MLIAHRGGSGHHLENTLAAFEHAVRSGCDAAELDVHLTRDGQLVVHHNGRLDHRYTRAPDGQWLTAAQERPIAALTLAQLQRYRLDGPNPATDYGRAFPELAVVPGQTLPTLAEVIVAVSALSPTFQLVVEIKSGCRFAPQGRCWQPLVDAVLAELDRLAFAGRTILCSFDWRALRYAKALRPQIPVWMTTDPFAWRDGARAARSDLPAGRKTLAALRAADAAGACWYDGFRPASALDAPRAVRAAGGDAWFAYHSDCNTEVLAAAHALDLPVAAWTVNLRDRTRRAQLDELGLDALCVDYF